MYLTEQLSSEAERHHNKDVEHVSLYRSVLTERQGVTHKKSGRLYYETASDALVPKGNLYRYCGLSAERLWNSADLWQQMDALADKYKHVLKGTTRDERTEELLKALEDTRVGGSPEAEKGVVSVGYAPLSEFLMDGRTHFHCNGFIALPVNGTAFYKWWSFRLMTSLVCLIQWIAPLGIFLYQWYRPTNKLLHWRRFVSELNPAQILCLGNDGTEMLHTLMGVILLEIIILIIHTYIRDQRANALKSSRLPFCRFWYVLGNVTNMWCCLITVFAAPVLFWSEESPTGTAMDAMSVLFIFVLDDFAGQAAQYAGVSDAEFQRVAMWQFAILSQCPVALNDLTDPGATSAENIWQIGFDSAGRLKKATSPDRCTRRIERNHATYDQPLLDASYTIFYRTSVEDRGASLPHAEACALDLAWAVLDGFFKFVQVVMPILWMAVNKPCGAETLSSTPGFFQAMNDTASGVFQAVAH